MFTVLLILFLSFTSLNPKLFSAVAYVFDVYFEFFFSLLFVGCISKEALIISKRNISENK